MTFQWIALGLTVAWLIIVLALFRKSVLALFAGLIVIGLFVFAALALNRISFAEIGLGIPGSWLLTAGYALLGALLIIAYGPFADRLAAFSASEPPTLDAFRPIQQSPAKLVAGILTAWIFGGVLEELIARGIILRTVELELNTWLAGPVAAGIAILIAGIGAGVMHQYQGKRAVIIIAQISVLFGILYVATGHNLWVVMLCHGLYDTVAFVRFAQKRLRYSK
jgi:membrane protease YdiL (CAAX protease family)